MLLRLDDVKAEADGFRTADSAEIVTRADTFSMLHPETLTLLYSFARRSSGLALEIGSYIGGSTVCIAHGLRQRGGPPLHSFEMGGMYLDHPALPSSDILGDLRKNLVRDGVADLVQIVPTNTASAWTCNVAGSAYFRWYLRRFVPPRSVGLLFVDSDGALGRDFWLVEPYLADQCLLIFDDYVSSGSSKGSAVKSFVDAGIRRKMLHDLGLYQWGTWAGQYLRPPAVRRTSYRVADRLGVSGACYIVPFFFKYRRFFTGSGYAKRRAV